MTLHFTNLISTNNQLKPSESGFVGSLMLCPSDPANRKLIKSTEIRQILRALRPSLVGFS